MNAEPGGGAPPWWVLVPGLAAWLLLMWGISEFRAAAQPVLVRETLAQLQAGHTVAFPGSRDSKSGITLTRDRLSLAVVRETLHILIDPDGHRTMYRAQRSDAGQEQP